MESQTHVALNRPLANFHPSIWGDQFLDLHMPQFNEGGSKEVVEELKVRVKKELKEASSDYMRLLKMVDAIQRLGIEYQFKEEIDEALQNLSENFDDYCKDNHDLYTTALSFRLLRQHGYRMVSCKIFEKFTDKKLGGFQVPNTVTGVLEFFDATHLRIHGEDILDQGYVFSRNYLESLLPDLRNPVAEQVRHALYEYSNRRGLTRLEARHYISIYDQMPCHHVDLLNLANLDFNLLQSLHKRELSDLCRWWKDLEVTTKLSFARDRLVETYFWGSGVYFETEYALGRKFLTKLQCLLSLIDDTFDAYGTFEEVQLFTDAIERWNIGCLDQLPDYMKIIYKALLQVFEEIEEEMIRQGRSYRINYGIEAVKMIVRAYFAEIKWREEKYKPSTQEYMQLATKSCGYLSVIIISFIGMGDVATKEAFDWVFSEPDMVKATLTICRLADDIASHQFEHQREHIPSAVECYTEEHKVPREEALKEFNDRIESAWKDINAAFLKPTKIPVPLLYRILNFTRGIEVIYTKGDWYTHVGPEMQSFIKQLYIDPVP